MQQSIVSQRLRRLALLVLSLAIFRPQLLLARTLAPLTRTTLESMPGGPAPELPAPDPVVTLPSVPTGESLSIGEANRGRLVNGVRLESDDLFLVRSHDENFGTAETVEATRRAVAEVARRFPGRPRIVVGDLSKEHGGRIRPHKSHQSGRDIDLGFYTAGDAQPNHFVPITAKNIDLERNWALIEALAAGEDVQYIFIDRRIQKLLRTYAAEVKKVPEKVLDGLFEYPRKGSLTTLVRHRRGHRNHLHVRFFSPQAVAAGEKYGAEALAQLGTRLDPWQAVAFSHVVRKGDTLARIAQRYKVELTDIMKWNRLKRRSVLQLGQAITLYRKVKVAATGGPTSICHAGPRAVGCWRPGRS
jgi:murein endopeptidase